MKLEVGKQYRCRDGAITTIKEIGDDDQYPIKDIRDYTYTTNGEYYGDTTEDRRDLVEEYIPPNKQFEFRERIEVRDDVDGRWVDRFYLGLTPDEKFICEDGKLSGVFYWKQARKINQVTELTLDQVAEKFGVPVSTLKIKK